MQRATVRQWTILFYVLFLCALELYAEKEKADSDALRPAASDAGSFGARLAQAQTQYSSVYNSPYSSSYSPEKSASINGAQPSLRMQAPVYGLCWSNDDTLFALTEQNALFVRDSLDNRLIHTIGFDGAMSLDFSWDVVTRSDMFMALSNNGRLSVWNFRDLPALTVLQNPDPSYSVQLDNTRRATAAAFSHSGNHMAVGYDDNSVSMSIVLHYTQKVSDKTLTGHYAPSYTLAFSDNDGFLASGGRDDRILIWNATDGSRINSLPFYSGAGTPVVFTKDSRNIISMERRNLISVRQFDGSAVLEIRPNSTIKTFAITGRGDALAVQTTEDNIEFYSLENGAYYGYVPPFNETSLTSYAFNSTDSVLLVGHADGSVYKLQLANVFLKPDEKPKDMELTPDEVVVQDPEHKKNQSEEPEKKEKASEDKNKEKKEKKEDKKEEKPEEEKEKWKPKLPDSRFMINLGLAARLLPSPYTFGLDFDAKARYMVTAGFYTGGGLSLGIGFPKKDFPYSYSLGGKEFKSPLMIDMSLFGSIGYQINFKSKKAPALFFECDPGARFSKLYRTKSGSTVTTKWYPSFAADFMVGAGWEYIEVSAGVDFDSILGVNPRVLVAGKIPVKIRSKAEREAAKQAKAAAKKAAAAGAGGEGAK